jgi:hypothetical protein
MQWKIGPKEAQQAFEYLCRVRRVGDPMSAHTERLQRGLPVGLMHEAIEREARVDFSDLEPFCLRILLDEKIRSPGA